MRIYDYNRAPNAHYQHLVRAWQNAGAVTGPIVQEYPGAYAPNVVEAAMEAGADGIEHDWWEGTDPKLRTEINASVLRFFPGDLAKPLAEDPQREEVYAGPHFWPRLLLQALPK